MVTSNSSLGSAKLTYKLIEFSEISSSRGTFAFVCELIFARAIVDRFHGGIIVSISVW